ncbi:MAG: LamG domain-containing protein, partial [Candidatus Binataceae bacterium]
LYPGTQVTIGPTIDEPAVYLSALTAAQIQNHYLAGITNPAGYGSAGVTGGSNYKAVILIDQPIGYYRLDEASTSPVIIDSAVQLGNNGLYQGGVTFGATGVNSGDTAVTLDGSTGYVTTLIHYVNPQIYSLEAWFKTVSGYNKGGKIAGFNSVANGSGSSDRHIYMTNAGQIIFGTYDGAVHTVTSSASYNDGNWHYVVATATGSAIALYIDDNLIGTTSGGSQNYTGYWMLGYGDFGGWPSLPTSNYFGGSIDEAAVYPYALSATQVANHYSAR